MLTLVLASLAFLPSSGATPAEGEAWIHKAEDRLYRWPETAARLRFEAHTDMLAPMIAAMKSEIAKSPDPEASRFVAALEHVQLKGAVNAHTGKLESEIVIDYTNDEPRARAALAEIKKRLHFALDGCFASLPLGDPLLLRKGSTVSAAEELPGEYVVTIATPKSGEQNVLHIARDGWLPNTFEMSFGTLTMTYTEAAGQRCVPASVEMKAKGKPASRAEYHWQHVGDVWFPERVRLTAPSVQAEIVFDKFEIEAAKR